MKANFYIINREEKLFLPVWFKGYTSYHTAGSFKDDKYDYISWENWNEWERVKKSEIPKDYTMPEKL